MNHRILIADDNPEKLKAIELFILSRFESFELDFSYSYNSTIKKLKTIQYDLVILDMSMPTFDPKEGVTPQVKPLAGKDVMSRLKYKNNALPVIIITQFEIFGRMSDTIDLQNLQQNLSESFPDNFTGCVFYDPLSSSWSESLGELIMEVVGFE